MADQLQFRGGTTSEVSAASVASREIIIDTDTEQIAVGTSKKKTVMEDSSGRVGIGASAPLEKLHVSTGSTTNAGEVSIALGSTSATARLATIVKNTSSPYELRINAANHPTALAADIIFGDSNNERLRIDSSGDVLIGGTLPSAPNITLSANGVAQAKGGFLAKQDSGYFFIGQSTSNVNKVLLSSNGSAEFAGSVQVGTSSSSSFSSLANTLVVKGTGNNGITVSSGSTSSGNIFFADGEGTSTGRIQYQHNGDYMRVFTGDSERLRIDNTGSVLIGGTLSSAPNISLNANGSATFAGNTYIGTSPNIQLFATGSSKFGGTLSVGTSVSNADQNITLNASGSATFAGDITCTDNSRGLVLKSPDGTSFRLSVANDGTLSASSI